jgi:cytosine/adenosine deaminase-related metal-dependent hydrolase
MPLPDWIRLVIRERSRIDESSWDTIAAGLSESVAAGVATFGEISTAASLPAFVSGVRLTMLLEVIGFSRARAESALARVGERIASMRSIAQRFDALRLGISPHAPYTVSLELLQQLVVLANPDRLPISMHLAESEDELRFLAAGNGPFRELLEERSMWDPATVPRGSRPIDYLQLLADAPRALVIHGNYLTPEDHAFLAARSHRMTLVYCPRTHSYFCHPPYPLANALDAGVHVALGTDSRASNPDLDMLAELRHAARVHPHVSPQRLLAMATLDASLALGWNSHCGSITVGKQADLVALPLPGRASGSPDDVLAAVLYDGNPVRRVWIHGTERTPGIHDPITAD